LGAKGVWEIEEEESGGVLVIVEAFGADDEGGESESGEMGVVGAMGERNGEFCTDDKVPVGEERDSEFGDFDFGVGAGEGVYAIIENQGGLEVVRDHRWNTGKI
jgi:hypothetical protein